MDWADDIAYAVHDVEDFYRAGLIPLDRLVTDDEEVERFLDDVFSRWDAEGRESEYEEDTLRNVFRELMVVSAFGEPYSGSRRQRALLRSFTANLIGRYVSSITLSGSLTGTERLVRIRPESHMEVTMLKELTWTYVINNAGLATQQHGQRTIIRELFRVYAEAADAPRSWTLFPLRYRELLEEIGSRHDPESKLRVVSDLVCGMTEAQAVQVYSRLSGIALGSVLDAYVRV
jgi:dGTPase